MEVLLAASPIALVLGTMLGLRWSATRAGLVGLALAVAVGLFGFGLGTRTHPELGPGVALAGALAEATFTAATILLIVLFALSIFEMQRERDAVDAVRGGLERLTADPRMLALLVGWFFGLFIEGAAGFGAAAALAAPFLVRLGFDGLDAVAIALVGHCVGVTFGAVGTPVMPMVAATGLDATVLAAAISRQQLVLGWAVPLAVVVLAHRALGTEGGGKGPYPPLPRRDLAWALFAAASFLVPYALIGHLLGPELPTLAGALLGGALFALVLWWVRPRPAQAGATARPAGPRAGALLMAASPYAALVVLVLITRLVPPVREAIAGVELGWRWRGAFSGTMRVLAHPATLLLLALLAGAAIQRASLREVGAAVGRAGRQVAKVAVALLAMLGLSRLMVHAGMIEALATGMAGSTGSAYPFVAPAIGVLGTFVTGSATASNILFTELQVSTAQTLSLPVVEILASQGVGAAVGNIICPHNVVAAGATVGLAGGEGAVIRRTFLVCLAYTLLAGAASLMWTRI